MRAKCLTKKGTIGICSPSHLVDHGEFQYILSEIRKRGFGVREADNLYKDTYGYLAAPEERADDFNQMVADPDVNLIFFGGGEGGNELLPYIDYDLIRKNPKQICSYSDGTTLLNAVWALTGLETYYGQTPYLFKNITQYDEMQFMSHIVNGEAGEHISNSMWQVQTAGKAKGILVGGYARNFALLLGGRYFPVDLKKKYILFIEDADNFGVGYVSAMLSHIEQHEFMQSVTGVIFGHSFEKDHGRLLERLKRLGEQYQIPVVYCDDFGHGTSHAILPIGRMAELDTKNNTLLYR